MRVLYHFDAGSWLLGRLEEIGAAEGIEIVTCSEADEARFTALLGDAEVIWHTLRPIAAPQIAAAQNLKLIQKIGVGVNTIDLDAAQDHGVAVCNMPGTNSRAVAEMTLALMLACLRRLPAFHERTRRGEGWSWPVEMQNTIGELHGRTVGLAGFGAVPAILAPILEAMGARVIYVSRSPKPDAPGTRVDKATLLAESDILSLHMPLTEETQHWLDRNALAAMKPGALLVNTARGGLVDEAALVDALSSGRLLGAGLDVFEQEPAGPDNPLFALDTVVLAPHVAFFSRGTMERSLEVAVDNVRRLRDGRDLLHRVV